jgi:hypothetical protein
LKAAAFLSVSSIAVSSAIFPPLPGFGHCEPASRHTHLPRLRSVILLT